MSVLIKNVNKPQSCGDCWWIEHCDRWRNRNWGASPPDDCPIGQVPPHGRLISADLLKADFTGNFIEVYPTALVHAMIDDAPTIIPAEKKDDEKRILKKKAKKWMDEFSRTKIPLAFKNETERAEYVRAWARAYVGQKHHYPEYGRWRKE